MNNRLILFGTIYFAISAIFVNNIFEDQSSSLAYVYIFPVFWIVAGIALIILVKFGKVDTKLKWNKVGIFLSTPVPYWLIFITWSMLPMNESPSSTWERNVEGKSRRQVHYSYDNYQDKRIEYFSSKDSVTEDQPFPKTEEYLLDSILYFDRKGILTKKETYKNGRIKRNKVSNKCYE
jgi:hypothetical protein